MLFAERVQRFSRFFGQANNALRTVNPPSVARQDSALGAAAVLPESARSYAIVGVVATLVSIKRTEPLHAAFAFATLHRPAIRNLPDDHSG